MKKSSDAPLLKPQGPKTSQRLNDPTLSWISQDFPHLEPWRELALKWFKTLKYTSYPTLQALSLFLVRYLVQQGLPTEVDQVLRADVVLPDFFEKACVRSLGGVNRNNKVRAFLDFVLSERFSPIDPATGKKVLDKNYRNPVMRRHRHSFATLPGRMPGLTRGNDPNLTWVKNEYPQLESWRALASEWIKGPGAESGSISSKLSAISVFLGRYLIGQGLAVEPARLLDRNIRVPSFFETCCSKSNSQGGIRTNNYISNFLDFVLLKECSDLDDYGRPVVSPAFHNPISEISWSMTGKRTETNKVPLPYGYITRLRRRLICGETFKDWDWAQKILGADIGKSGMVGTDWFPVTREQIDQDDPDCVWRIRKTVRGEILEMWSPVRWVTLAFKLLLPLRTFQVRMLDSGEGDTWYYEKGNWRLNEGPLASGKPGQSRRQGFLHRSVAHDGTITTQCYANTNKTADVGKSGSDKGFYFPWVTFGDPLDDVFYWAEKLRNWQMKYNPISRLTRWTELDGRHIQAKSDVQIAGYPDTAFLFRTPEAAPLERHFPISDGLLDTCWYYLLESFEEDLAKAGETLKNGGRIRLVPPEERNSSGSVVLTTNHPLHSLRVSLITALVIDGKVPIEIMQKIVGHTRLLMTIYYVVPGEAHIRLTLEDGVKRLEASAEASTENYLLNTEIEELQRSAIAVDPEGLSAAIPAQPGDRNPIGWEMMADGCCLMGGNTSPAAGNAQIGGCYNGGSNIGSVTNPRYAPVPGGPRNCIRCRWFVTMPHYFYALVSRLNNLLWVKTKEQVLFMDLQQEKESLDVDRYDAILAGVPFDRINELRQVDRRLETAASRLNTVIANITACLDLTLRCQAALNKPLEGMGVVTTGGAAEIRSRIDGIDSELMQLAQICEDLEVYPDLPPAPDAVFRRSQLMDMALLSDGYKPLFLAMSEEEQKLNVNALMREMARRADPADPIRGRVKVVTLMDLKMNLMEHLGFGVAECMPQGIACESMDSAKPAKVKINGRRNVLHNKHSS